MIHARDKKGVETGWPTIDGLSIKQAQEVLDDGDQVGIQAGEVSNWLCAVDCDTQECVELAPYFLPKTLCSGKQGIPTHYIYISEGMDHYQAKNLAMDEILRVRAAARGQGHLFVVPPSMHPEKGPYQWMPGFDPDLIVRIAPENLLAIVRNLAAASLIAEHLEDEGRHDYSLSLAGFLLNNGVSESPITQILESVWSYAGAPVKAMRDLARNIEDTADKVAEGEPVTGGPTLNDLVEGLPSKLGKILGFDRRRSKPPTAPPTAATPGSYHLTDLGNGRRLVARHGEDLHYMHPWKKWFVWDSSRWVMDETGAAWRQATETIASIYSEATSEPDPDKRKAIARHAQSSESESRVRAMLNCAANVEGIPVPVDNAGSDKSTPLLDQDPWLLNCRNGTLDLRTGNLRDPRRGDLITKITRTPYQEGAQAHTFQKFLKQVLPDPEVRQFLQRLAGYCLTGDVSERVLPFLYGSGANGKTTLVNTFLEILAGYARQAAPDLLIVKSRTHPTEIASLFGTRFVPSVEVEEGRQLAESLVKQLTGTDYLSARRMREDFWDFKPTHKIFLVANHKPIVRGTDYAIWSRIKLIPFEITIPEDERDTSLPDKLRAEYPGILAWAVKGCQDWQNHGLAEPKSVTDATDIYRAEMDVIADFIEECCITGEQYSCTFKALYKRYTTWCEGYSQKPLEKRAFGEKLTERSILPDRGTGNAPIRRGIDLFYDTNSGGQNFVTPDIDHQSSEQSAEGNSQDRTVILQDESNDNEPDQSSAESVEHTENSPSDTYQSYPRGGTAEPPESAANRASSQDESYRSYPQSDIAARNALAKEVIANQGNLGNSEAEEYEKAVKNFVTLPENLESVIEYVRENLRDFIPLGIDIETTGLHPRTSRIRLMQVSDGEHTFVIDCFKVDPTPLLEALVEKGQLLVAHNMAFEWAHIYHHYGVALKNIADTQILSQLVYAGDRSLKHSLEYVAQREIGEELSKDLQTSDWSAEQLTDEQLDYAANDAEFLRTLYELLQTKVEEHGMEWVARVEHRAIPFTARVALNGIPFDKEEWNRLAEKAREKKARVDERLKEVVPDREHEQRDEWDLSRRLDKIEVLEACGLDLGESKSTSEKALKLYTSEATDKEGIAGEVAQAVLAFSKAKRAKDEEAMQEASAVVNRLAPAPLPKPTKEWNFGSPKQVQEAAALLGFDLSEGTGVLHLLRHRDDHEFFTLMLGRRKVAKLAESYAENWLEEASFQDGRIYPSWRQIGAESGRMSASRPGIQQIPKDPEYRSCVRTPDGSGRTLIHIDYSQIEMRIAARYAPDKEFYRIFKEGEQDVHDETARLITGKENPTKQERSKAKAVGFGLLYGMYPDTLADHALKNFDVEMSPHEAEKFYKKFFSAHKGLRAWHKRVQKAFYNNKKKLDAESVIGRKRWGIPVINEAINHPIQSTGADGLKLAMALIHERRDELPESLEPILPMHDELVFEVDEDEAARAYPKLEEIMREGMDKVVNWRAKHRVSIELDGGIGDRWD
jgi:P4 family phage/plasmid primase-like protien